MPFIIQLGTCKGDSDFHQLRELDPEPISKPEAINVLSLRNKANEYRLTQSSGTCGKAESRSALQVHYVKYNIDQGWRLVIISFLIS